MTETQDSSQPTPPGPGDPRYSFAMVTSAVRGLIDNTTPAQLGDPTPCSEYCVKDLLNHINLVMQRVATIGNGGHWSDVTEDGVAQDDGHAEAFGEAAHAVMHAWTDGAKLDAMYEVPWGELPGGPMMHTYTAELATHAWDLATATSQPLEIEDEVLAGAIVAAKMLPAEGRDDEAMPFDPVVDPGLDAPVLRQIAGWMGRKVNG